MVNMMLWTTLSFSTAVAQGAVMPSVMPRQASGDVSLAAIIRSSPQVQRHQKSILSNLSKGLPYSEGLLQATKEVKLDGIKEDERKCMYLRNSVKQEGFQSIIDINPNSDAPDVVTDAQEKKIEVTTSTAKINSERLGWNKEVSTEIGGSATAEVSGGIGVFSASLSATVYGNQRNTGGQNGEASTQTEYRQDIRREETCPPNSICRIVTWTYTRTIVGNCFLTPYFDQQCSTGSEWNKSKYSLGLFPTCQPAAGVAAQFFDFDYDKVRSASGFGPNFQGIKMHKPEVVKTNKYDEKCTFSYALRYENGSPIKAMANIIQTEPNPMAKKSEVSKVPKALKWVGNDEKFCKLENKWYWQPGNYFFIPKAEGGQDDWEQRDDLPEPEGLKEKCPESIFLSNKRAEAVDDELPPSNKLVKVVMIEDGVPEFLKQLSNSKNEGYAANLLDDRLVVDEPGFIERPIDGSKPEPEPSVKECVARLE